MLNQACGLTHSPLTRDHGAVPPLKGILLHQVSPKGAMVLPDHLPTEFKNGKIHIVECNPLLTDFSWNAIRF
jgi:hypothetical protein